MWRAQLYHSQVFQRTVGMADLAVAIGQQLKFSSSLAQNFGGSLAVYAHAENYRVARGVLGLIDLEVMGLAGTAGSLILGIKIEDDPVAVVVLGLTEAPCCEGNVKLGAALPGLRTAARDSESSAESGC